MTPIEEELAVHQRALELTKTRIAMLEKDRRILRQACESALDWFVSVAADGAPATTIRTALDITKGE